MRSAVAADASTTKMPTSAAFSNKVSASSVARPPTCGGCGDRSTILSCLARAIASHAFQMWRAQTTASKNAAETTTNDDDDWDTDPNFVNDVSEKQQRWGSKTIAGSGRQDAVK